MLDSRFAGVLPLSTNHVLIGAVVLLLFVVAFLLLKPKDHFAPKRLLTKNEEEFFWRLRQGLPDFYIFPQVAFRAIVRPDAPSNTKAYFRQLGKIGSKHFDFLICNERLDVVAIVELDDRTHIVAKDVIRDALTAEAGYMTIRYESKIRPSVAEIADDFSRIMSKV